jgi:hypothetical protein
MKLFQNFLPVLFFGIAMVVPKTDAATPSPLPSLNLVLQRVMQTCARENADYHIFNQHYFYTRDKVTEFFDGAGRLKERQEKQSVNSPNPSVKASLPRPTPDVVSNRRSTAVEDQPNVHGVALGKKEDLLSPDIIKRFKFTLVGRDTLNGRPALIVDFKPASDDLPVFNVKDRFIDCMTGRAWVDEGDFVLEKVDLHLKQKVSVLGGVAGSVSKFSFSFDRERTPDGLWFTRDLNWHLEAREATFHRVVEHHEEVSALQKMG